MLWNLHLIVLLCTLSIFEGVHKVSIFDELILIYSVVLLICYIFVDLIKGKIRRTSIALLCYALYFIFLYGYSSFVQKDLLSALQIVITVKYFVILFAVDYIIDSNVVSLLSGRGLRIIEVFIAGVVFVLALALVINLMIPEYFVSNLLGYQIQYREGSVRPNVIFQNAGIAGYAFVLLGGVLFFEKFKRRIMLSPIFSCGLIFLLVVILSNILTVRKVLYVIPFVVYLFKPYLRKQIYYSLISISAVLGVILLTQLDSFILTATMENVEKFTHNDHGYVRGLLIYSSYLLSSSLFPIGAGPGTFGTYASRYGNLSAYEFSGFPLSLVKPGAEDVGIYESYFASIAGEGGVIGMFVIFMMFGAHLLYVKGKNDRFHFNLYVMLTGFGFMNAITGPFYMNGLIVSFCIMAYVYVRAHNIFLNISRERR